MYPLILNIYTSELGTQDHRPSHTSTSI